MCVYVYTKKYTVHVHCEKHEGYPSLQVSWIWNTISASEYRL